MRAYFLDGARNLVLKETEAPTVGPHDVLIRVNTVGVCGSDIEYYLHNRIGPFVPRAPLVLGHEIAGVVEASGDEVLWPAEETRVAIDPSIPCRHCDHCRAGRHNLCSNLRFIGTAATVPHIPGGLGELVALPATNCYIVPDHLSWEEAACLEPLSVAVHAAMRPGSVAGAQVLVTGGGTIGQLLAMVARAFGAGTVALSDIQASRRKLALHLGADYGLDPTNEGEVSRAMEETGGFDIVFEASGAGAAVTSALELVNRGGTVVQVGSISAPIEINHNLIMVKELRVLGSFRYGEVYKISMDLLSTRRVDVRPLVSATFPFSQAVDAFELAAERSTAIKVQIDMTRTT